MNARGRKPWTDRWDENGAYSLLQLRSRAEIAAAFAQGVSPPGANEHGDWFPVANAIARVTNLFSQAEKTANPGVKGFDPPALRIDIRCTYVDGEDPEIVQYHFNDFPRDGAGSRIGIRIRSSGRGFPMPDAETEICVRYRSSAVPLACQNFITQELEHQLGHSDPALLFARPSYRSIAAATRNDRLWDLRVRITEFLQRFLACYRLSNETKASIDPFTVFFLLPRTARRDLNPSDHVPSGFFGYRYFLDEGQLEHLKEFDGLDDLGDISEEVLADEMSVPFPKGLCGEVFLTATDSGPDVTKRLISEYDDTKPQLAMLEEVLLESSSLFEIPVFAGGVLTPGEYPDGPELIMGLRIPHAKLPNPVGPTTLEDKLEFATYENLPLQPGEMQVVAEFAKRQVSRYYASTAIRRKMGMVGSSTAMEKIRRDIGQIAANDIAVMILGGSGTGKELIAKAIHEHSERADGPFIAVNIRAIAPGLMESELFGHKKGAFTGADKDTVGRIAEANHGTLFLDEVGDIPKEIQVKLLRVLQEYEVPVVGGGQRRVDFRLITATHYDLLDPRVRKKRLRQDFYYRIKRSTIRAPELRNRKEDIAELAGHFVSLYGAKHSKIKELSDAALVTLRDHDWPGNVRELEGVIEAAVVNAAGPVIEVEDLDLGEREDTLEEVRKTEQSAGRLQSLYMALDGNSLSEKLVQAELRIAQEALAFAGGDISLAADDLGIPEVDLSRLLEDGGQGR